MILRRRRLPDHLVEPYEAFRALVPRLERAKDALTTSVPGTRLPGRPLAETLMELEEGLREVEAGMAGWRAPEVEEQWRAAREGLRRSLALAERLRLEAPQPEGFEGLIGLVGELIAPLEAFEAAVERFRELRSTRR